MKRIEKVLNLCSKLNKMTKSIIITYNESDESLLMAFFKKIKVKTETLQPKSEIETIRKRLYNKYVVTGLWVNMNDEEREDAALAETMIYAQEQPDYHVYSEAESKNYRAKLRKKLTTHADY